MREREYREFNVGDRVMVVSEPYRACPFSWVTGMTEMCGKPVTIDSKRYSPGPNTYVYTVSEATWNWYRRRVILKHHLRGG